MTISIGRATALLCILGLLCECSDNEQRNSPPLHSDTTANMPVNAPSFDADSAYAYIQQQVDLGPRTPGSAAQSKCAAWMEGMLKRVCDTLYKQSVQVKGGDGKMLPCINLIGVINPGAVKRILFVTHWDSRPWADQDSKDADKPVLAADDGGSGVGVLLEIARQIKTKGLSTELGIDILLTDVEDYGKTEWGDDSYCLGTQYWAKHAHIAGYKALFGVLLDMVGAKGAQFPMEGFSIKLATDVQQKVWHAASDAGYSSFFPYMVSADITDDHLPINRIAGIKTIDVINLTPDPEKPFAQHWHTHADNMTIIDKSTLKAVGQTMLQLIYEMAAKSGIS